MTTDRAREMRHAPTEPERRLWAILYGLRQGGYHFRRQHPIDPYFADFACDGITHTADAERARDKVRTDFIESKGFKVVRFWNNDIMGSPDAVFAEIERALVSLAGPTPTPDPSPSEGGGRPRKRKLRTGLQDLAARVGDAVGSPSPLGGGVRGGGQRAPALVPPPEDR